MHDELQDELTVAEMSEALLTNRSLGCSVLSYSLIAPCLARLPILSWQIYISVTDAHDFRRLYKSDASLWLDPFFSTQPQLSVSTCQLTRRMLPLPDVILYSLSGLFEILRLGEPSKHG